MQTILLLNLVRLPRYNTPLRAVSRTLPAADTSIRDFVTLWHNSPVSKGINFPKNRADSKVKIFNFGVPYLKNRSYLFNLLCFGYGVCFCREPYHFFEAGIGENLHPAVREQFFAEVLTSCGKEVEAGFIQRLPVASKFDVQHKILCRIANIKHTDRLLYFGKIQKFFCLIFIEIADTYHTQTDTGCFQHHRLATIVASVAPLLFPFCG